MTTTASDTPRADAPAAQAAPHASAPARHRRFISARLAPWAASVGVHIALGTIAAVSLWSLTHRTPSRRSPADSAAPPAPLISFHAPGDAPSPGNTGSLAAQRPSTPPTQHSPDPPMSRATPAAPVPMLRSLIGLPAVAGSEPREPAAPVVSIPIDLPPSVPDPAGVMGIQRENGPKGGADLPVRFAGAGASSARRIVYAVDASGPMVTSLPDVIAEIERSAQRLSSSQQFAVVIFRDRGEPLPTTEAFMPVLMRATPTARRHLGDWLAGVQPAGRSNPLEGLRAALAYQPDAIFLVSRSIARSGVPGDVRRDAAQNDQTRGPTGEVMGGTGGPMGGWGEKGAVLAELDRLNPKDAATGLRRVAIKAIQFIDDDPTGIMQAIGETHGGPAAGGPGYILIRTRDDLAPPP